MIHAGNAITVQMLSDGIAEFRFDLQGESVNKFNRATIEDFKAAIDAVKANGDIKALIEAKKHENFVQRMVDKGYTSKQVRLLCEWYLRVRKAS